MRSMSVCWNIAGNLLRRILQKHNMVIRIFLVALFLVVAPIRTIVIAPAQAQDAAETSFMFGVLRDGDRVTGEFNAVVTARLYGFYGSMGDVVRIDMIPLDDDLDPLLVLLDTRGQVIAQDDDSGDNLAAQIANVTLPADGAYLILATSFVFIDNILPEIDDIDAPDVRLPTPVRYQLSIDGITAPDDVPETISLATRMIELDTTLTGEISDDEPVVFVTYEGRAEQIVDIFLNSRAFDPVIHIFRSNGDRIIVADDDLERRIINSAIRDFVLPADDTYLIVATDVFFYNIPNPAAPPEHTFRHGAFELTVRSDD